MVVVLHFKLAGPRPTDGRGLLLKWLQFPNGKYFYKLILFSQMVLSTKAVVAEGDPSDSRELCHHRWGVPMSRRANETSKPGTPKLLVLVSPQIEATGCGVHEAVAREGERDPADRQSRHPDPRGMPALQEAGQRFPLHSAASAAPSSRKTQSNSPPAC